jgi:hypothetical protein
MTVLATNSSKVHRQSTSRRCFENKCGWKFREVIFHSGQFWYGNRHPNNALGQVHELLIRSNRTPYNMACL